MQEAVFPVVLCYQQLLFSVGYIYRIVLQLANKNCIATIWFLTLTVNIRVLLWNVFVLLMSSILHLFFSFFFQHEDNSMDIREYVIALSVVCRPAKTLETMKLAFKVRFCFKPCTYLTTRQDEGFLSPCWIAVTFVVFKCHTLSVVIVTVIVVILSISAAHLSLFTLFHFISNLYLRLEHHWGSFIYNDVEVQQQNNKIQTKQRLRQNLNIRRQYSVLLKNRCTLK